MAAGDVTLGATLGNAGAVSFADGVRLDNDTSAGGASVASYYREADHATTFTHDGSGGTSSSQTLKITRIGRVVTVYIPAFTCTTGTNSTVLSANTVLPSWARPAATLFGCNQNYTNESGTSTETLHTTIEADGDLKFYVRGGGTFFTDATTTQILAQAMSYSV